MKLLNDNIINCDKCGLKFQFEADDILIGYFCKGDDFLIPLIAGMYKKEYGLNIVSKQYVICPRCGKRHFIWEGGEKKC